MIINHPNYSVEHEQFSKNQDAFVLRKEGIAIAWYHPKYGLKNLKSKIQEIEEKHGI